MDDDYMCSEEERCLGEDLKADQQNFPLAKKNDPMVKGAPEGRIATPLRLRTRVNADGETKPCQDHLFVDDPAKQPCRMMRAKSFSPDRNLKDVIMKVVQDSNAPQGRQSLGYQPEGEPAPEIDFDFAMGGKPASSHSETPKSTIVDEDVGGDVQSYMPPSAKMVGRTMTIPATPDGGSWDWPLSRTERKARLHMVDRHVMMLDMQDMAHKLMRMQKESSKRRRSHG